MGGEPLVTDDAGTATSTTRNRYRLVTLEVHQDDVKRLHNLRTRVPDGMLIDARRTGGKGMSGRISDELSEDAIPNLPPLLRRLD